jgi:hypothetical protein
MHFILHENQVFTNYQQITAGGVPSKQGMITVLWAQNNTLDPQKDKGPLQKTCSWF